MEDKTQDVDTVYFVGKSRLAPGQVDLHRSGSEALARSLEEVKTDWEVITTQISRIVSNTSRSLAYSIDEIEISLAFNAKGKLAFIAEAGVEASIKLKLKRNSDGKLTGEASSPSV